MTKPCHLEVNDSGGWRRVMTFDATDDDDADSVMHLADLRRAIAAATIPHRPEEADLLSLRACIGA